MVFIDDVKDAIRENGTASDMEISDLISAAKADLRLSGVHSIKVDETDPLIKRAIILYCKANFGYDEKSEKFEKSYISLKNHLALSAEYTEVVVDEGL